MNVRLNLSPFSPGDFALRKGALGGRTELLSGEFSWPRDWKRRQKRPNYTESRERLGKYGAPGSKILWSSSLTGIETCGRATAHVQTTKSIVELGLKNVDGTCLCDGNRYCWGGSKGLRTLMDLRTEGPPRYVSFFFVQGLTM